MLQGPPSAARVTDLLGQLVRLAEPLLRGPEPPVEVVQQPQLPQRLTTEPVGAGQAGGPGRGQARPEGLPGSIEVTPSPAHLTEHDQRPGPNAVLRSGQRGQQLGLSLVQALQGGERLPASDPSGDDELRWQPFAVRRPVEGQRPGEHPLGGGGVVPAQGGLPEAGECREGHAAGSPRGIAC